MKSTKHKIIVVGLGYVGLSNAVLLAQDNEVIGIDVSKDKVDLLKNRVSPIVDPELSDFLANKDLNLSASTDLEEALPGAEFVVVATPTDYDELTNNFNTASVESVIRRATIIAPEASIIVKSTIPVGFTDRVRLQLGTDKVFFSPEFLREGRALYDNLYPDRIIVGDNSDGAKSFARLLKKAAIKEDVLTIFMGAREAESVKLFSNAYLAMRISFFNELDTFSLENSMNSEEIIRGVSADRRIGRFYNNPSFGYGGYCLPKDTKQLKTSFHDIPQDIISAVIKSNATRKSYLINYIVSLAAGSVGVYRLGMKTGSDNYRHSSTIDLIHGLIARGVEVIIYEPNIDPSSFGDITVLSDIDCFFSSVDLVIANRVDERLKSSNARVFTPDVFGTD